MDSALNLPNIASKFLIIDMFLTVGLNVCAEYVDVFMTFLCMKFHLHKSTGSLANDIVPKGREHFHIAVFLKAEHKLRTF
jgi:hypothetical protein